MTDRQTQTAELLKLLGEDTAQAVLSHLRPELAKSIRTQMESPEAKQLKLRQKRELLKDFEWFFDFALQAKPAAGLKVFSGEDEEADHKAESKQPEGEVRLTGDPMVDLGRLSIFQLAGALESEQPRTVAILLNNVPPELAANVLSYFPEEHRQLVAKQLSKEQDAPQVLVERIARATVQRGATLPADPPDRRDHLDRLGEVMREVPKSYRKDMMAAIEEEDAELSAALLKKLYRFDDIAGLEPHIVQQILGEVDGTTLTTAMFQADQNVLDTILGNLSRRARGTIEEELQFQTRVPEAQVTAAREAVAEIIAKIDQEGE
ncbi:FliG C-terminal domain-containing protein [Fuerstiella marisgermanici]|uniref:Flagellar motor switch protein FliG n=1 Tax=Fuerstiella marisgermanici TaxID=1891926 RepID=A0A1P8WJ87_9PLAN|nr:FliG C-terminal domain-containing protein [Fuerstiella marisgermanici]APZ94120.1 Flagellar motor switch protein FliG [Fuerstiella marisgermanici]